MKEREKEREKERGGRRRRRRKKNIKITKYLLLLNFKNEYYLFYKI